MCQSWRTNLLFKLLLMPYLQLLQFFAEVLQQRLIFFVQQLLMVLHLYLASFLQLHNEKIELSAWTSYIATITCTVTDSQVYNDKFPKMYCKKVKKKCRPSSSQHDTYRVRFLELKFQTYFFNNLPLLHYNFVLLLHGITISGISIGHISYVSVSLWYQANFKKY